MNKYLILVILVSLILYLIAFYIRQYITDDRILTFNQFRKLINREILPIKSDEMCEKRIARQIILTFEMNPIYRNNKLYLGYFRKNLNINDLSFIYEDKEMLLCYVDFCFDLYKKNKIKKIKKDVSQCYYVCFTKNDYDNWIIQSFKEDLFAEDIVEIG